MATVWRSVTAQRNNTVGLLTLQILFLIMILLVPIAIVLMPILLSGVLALLWIVPLRPNRQGVLCVPLLLNLDTSLWNGHVLEECNRSAVSYRRPIDTTDPFSDYDRLDAHLHYLDAHLAVGVLAFLWMYPESRIGKECSCVPLLQYLGHKFVEWPRSKGKSLYRGVMLR